MKDRYIIDTFLNETDLTTAKQFRDLIGSWKVISFHMSHHKEPGRLLMNHDDLEELRKELRKEKLKLPYAIDVSGDLSKKLKEVLWINEDLKEGDFGYLICPKCGNYVKYFAIKCHHCKSVFAQEEGMTYED